LLENSFEDLVNGDRGQQVNEEHSLHVVESDFSRTVYFVAHFVNETGSEVENNVHEENEIRKGIEHSERQVLEKFWLESNVERNGEAVVDGNSHHHDVPLEFQFIALLEHEALVLLLLVFPSSLSHPLSFLPCNFSAEIKIIIVHQ
jgi:hypothetical protein